MRIKNKISVIGGGSWATAIVKMLSNSQENIGWWIRDQELIDHILEHGNNARYLPAVQFDKSKLNLSSSITEVINDAELVILAVPSAFIKDALLPCSVDTLQNKIVFSAIKGIVPDENVIVGEFLHAKYNLPLENIGVITGPCHAEEVALEKLSYLTLACQNMSNAELLAEELRCRYIKACVSDDIYGTEYSAVLKNVFAIASGICHGLGYGDNFQAVLISNAIKEIKHFLNEVHPISRDIKSSAYLGDLLVTAYSQFSRNRTFGNMIGKGYSVKSAQFEMNMIAEGYYAVKCINEILKSHKIEMPITNAVYNVLYEQITPRIEMKILADNLS